MHVEYVGKSNETYHVDYHMCVHSAYIRFPRIAFFEVHARRMVHMWWRKREYSSESEANLGSCTSCQAVTQHRGLITGRSPIP